MLSKLSLVAVGILVAASAFAGENVEGSCLFEKSGKILKLQSVDPDTHFGTMAIGATEEHDDVSVWTNYNEFVTVDIRSLRGVSYAIFPIHESGTTVLKAGVFLQSKENPESNEWLTCDLVAHIQKPHHSPFRSHRHEPR
jgi:hypothetical protein